MEITSLVNISTDVIFDAWQKAFAGYARTWTREEFEYDMVRRGFTPQLSFGVFMNGELASFILNGTGSFNGMPAVYDTGTGTIEAFRGRGLTRQLFESSLPAIEASGAVQYVLEVLQDNSKAIAVYRGIGFSVARELNYFVSNICDITIQKQVLPTGIFLGETTLPEQAIVQPMWAFQPSWQNSFGAISRCPGRFRTVAAFSGDEIAGYGIIDPVAGDIPQLAVSKEYRRRGIGSALLATLLSWNRHTRVKLINTDAKDGGTTAFLSCCGMPLSGKQYEMILPLKAF